MLTSAVAVAESDDDDDDDDVPQRKKKGNMLAKVYTCHVPCSDLPHDSDDDYNAGDVSMYGIHSPQFC